MLLTSCFHGTIEVDNTLFDFSKRETLGLERFPEMKTYTVFTPNENQNHYNHAASVIAFKGSIYVQWQTSKSDEDAPDTHVVYSFSSNFNIWSNPQPLTESDSTCYTTTSGGWYATNDRLTAYINVWKNDTTLRGGRDGYTYYRSSTDGIKWSELRPVLTHNGDTLHGIIEQDVRALPNGRLLTAIHLMPGLTAKPCYTDDKSGVRGWRIAEMNNLPMNSEKSSRELEPSWFVRSDDAIVMIMRDQSSTYKKLASVSHDNGNTWTTPVIVDTPDSRSKQCAGNLPNGKGAYMIYNPSNNKERLPLAIVLSEDGYTFDKAYLLRSGAADDLPLMRHLGKYKRLGYSYPKSTVHNNRIYVSYATNKEDIHISEIVFPMCVPFEKH
jgi:hypothetical protein